MLQTRQRTGRIPASAWSPHVGQAPNSGPRYRSARSKPAAAQPTEVKPGPRAEAGRKPPDGAWPPLILAGAGWFGYHYATVGRFMVSTDDAYVRANNTTLGAKVPGYVADITVDDNTRCRRAT